MTVTAKILVLKVIGETPMVPLWHSEGVNSNLTQAWGP